MTRMMCAALVVVGCGDGGAPGNERTVTRAEMGEAWPLTVDEGTLRCDGAKGVGAATIEVDGEVYALNGTAKSRKAGVNLTPVWAKDPTIPGAYKPIGPLIQEALKLCR
jgi:hypothetical protein